jgi:prepilin-type N-terminal cleavage/methylation domain-containing protein
MLRFARAQTALSPLGAAGWKRWLRRALDERGFTLIELVVVMAILGITTAMFSVTYTTTISRSSHVQAQNIAQTEVRAALNQLVSDLRDATTGTTTTPIVNYGNSSISFYAPNHLAPNSTTGAIALQRITYSLNLTSHVLQRRATDVTSYKTDGTPIDPGDTGTIHTIGTILTPATGNPSSGGWYEGQMFKYCKQSPPDMTIDPSNSTSAELITWQCQVPADKTELKTIVVRAVMSPYSNSERFTYGAVATLRWNAS